MMIRCSHCKESVKVNAMYALPIVVIVFSMAMGGWFYLESQALTLPTKLAVVGILGLIIEYAYFAGLRRGIIKSTLIEIDE